MRLTRNKILSILKNNQCVISTHEHLGRETLIFENGFKHTYSQKIDDLFKNLNNQDWVAKHEYIASIVTTMPQYYFSKNNIKRRKDNSNYESDIYGESNKKLIGSCLKWYKENQKQIPLPFISVDIGTNFNELEKKVKKSPFPIMGIKLHPPARKFSIKDLKNTGFFEFLLRVKLPILLHCGRRNMPGDFNDIFFNFLSEVIKYNLTVSIAHAGFLDDKIKKIKKMEKVYVDISPWSVIIDSAYGIKGVKFNVKKLTDFIKLFPAKVLYGGDSPFDVQIWSNGEKHGMGRNFDLMILNKAIQEIGLDLIENIFYYNPIKYLNGK